MADQIDTTKTAPTRTEFAATLIDLDKGRVHDDLTDRMAELIEAVCHTNKKGTLTLTVTVEPQDPSTFEDTGMLLVEGDVKVNPPRVKRAASIFYATGVDGQITRQDPAVRDPRDRD